MPCTTQRRSPHNRLYSPGKRRPRTGRGCLALILLLGMLPLQSLADESTRLRAWLDEQYEEELRFAPEQLSALGRRELYDQLDDYSIEALDRQLTWYAASVEELRSLFDYEQLDAEGKTSYDFWMYRLERQRGYRKYLLQHFPMNQEGGVHSGLPQFMINYHNVESLQDMHDYNTRIGAIGRALDQVMQQVADAAERGVRAPRFSYDMVIEQLESIVTGAPFTEGTDSPLWADARAKISALQDRDVIRASEAETVLEENRQQLLSKLAPAYAKALRWFQSDRENSESDPQGAHSLPDGDDYYAFRLRYYTTTDLTAAEIHQLGIREVRRIHAEIEKIMKAVSFDGSLGDFFEYIRSDDRFYYADSEEGRMAFRDESELYLKKLEAKLPEYFGILPQSDLEVRRVEAFRERDGAAAFYEQGTADGSRPGVYYMHLSDMRSNNRTDLQTTAYHEGNPGHHMQSSIAAEQEDLPHFRNDVWYSGYGEGWALYAEQLAWEMGAYEDPYYDAGHLVAEVFRAIRLVVDTGIHAFGWSEERAVQYMLANSAIPEGAVRSEIRRYIVWPGQATAYKIGMLKILELREYAQQMLGEGFDIRDFHDQVLGGGSLPLSILESRIRNWVRSEQTYLATVRRGPFGVAHIEAQEFGSLGYGEGYAVAEDHVCNIAQGLIQARGESASFLGAGEGQKNIALDALVRGLDLRDQGRAALAAQSVEVRDWLAGYSAGYNRYLREHPGGRNTSWCSGADWLLPASPLDFMSRMVMMAQTLPRMSAAVVAAQPPQQQTAVGASKPPNSELLAALDAASLSGMGSNAWALGKDLSENGRGMLLANPHYPWYGGSRFWEKHLTIPGRFDVYGAQLLGAPGVAIGFNRNLGWTHTVSASQRLVIYRLALDAEDPMRYRYGDAFRDIEEKDLQIPVRQADGSLRVHRQKLYLSHYGPLLALPNMHWDARYAYAVRDANAENYSLIAQWKAMAEASNMDEFIDAHRRFNAMPWVNTIAASADGRAVYLDNSTVGNLSDEAQDAWRESLQDDPLAAGLYAQRGMLLVDGSDPRFEWIDDPDVPISGTVPFAQRPLLERSDYTFNSNDSYWLSNPAQPMSGASVLYGPVGTSRSLRTRMNIRMLQNAYGDAGDDRRFSRQELRQALFSNRGLSAELLLDSLVAICRSAGEHLAPACEVLAAYDGTLNLDSAGALLFREWITRYDYRETRSAGTLFAKAFDASDPVATPNTLGDEASAIAALEEALKILEAAELPLDATLRDTQFAWRGGKAIAVHGGSSYEGVANLQVPGDPSDSPISGVQPHIVGESRYLTDAGYPIIHGSSFMMTLGFDDEGPVAEALLSYSQSGNPNSPHFTDQTLRYANKDWRSVAFDAADVRKNMRSVRVLRTGGTP